MLKVLAPFRSLLSVIFYPFFISICSAATVIFNLLFNRRSMDDFFIRAWGRGSLWLFGVQVKVQGLENLPSGGCVLMFNHSSFFDVFAMVTGIPSFRFGAKIELFSIPIFGAAMRRVGVLPIARQRREEVFKLYEGTVGRIRMGEKIALAPEGTRQADEKILGSFKAGPFVLAINSQCPVVPVIIRNAGSVLGKKSIIPNWRHWTQKIEIQILEPITTIGLSLDDRPLLQEKTRAIMNKIHSSPSMQAPD